jgi:hypothetical protein
MKTLCGVRLKSRFLRCLGNCSFRSRPGADGSFRSLLAARRKSLARNSHAAKQSECCDSDVARRTNDLVSQKRRTKRITEIPAQSSPSLPKTSAIWTPWKRRGAPFGVRPFIEEGVLVGDGLTILQTSTIKDAPAMEEEPFIK